MEVNSVFFQCCKDYANSCIKWLIIILWALHTIASVGLSNPQCNPFHPTWNHYRQKEKVQILLQINHTHCVYQLIQTFAVQKHLCGHYLSFSSFAQMFQSELKRVVHGYSGFARN